MCSKDKPNTRISDADTSRNASADTDQLLAWSACAVTLQQVLVMIAIISAPTRWLWRRARMAAFESAMQQAALYISITGERYDEACRKTLVLFRQFLKLLLRV